LRTLHSYPTKLEFWKAEKTVISYRPSGFSSAYCFAD
jgi:hypothetical protein